MELLEQKSLFDHNTEIEDLGGLKRRIKITYNTEGVDRAMDKAVKEVKPNFMMKGFRKGKVPEKLIKQYLKKDLQNIVMSILSQEGLTHACYENELNLMSKPELKDVKFDDDGTFVCVLDVEVRPKINLNPYVGISLEKPRVDIDKLFAYQKDEFLSNHVQTKEKEVVELNDEVIVDFVVFKDDEEIAKQESFSYVVCPGEPPFNDSILGTKPNETYESRMVLPTYMGENAGEEAKIRITVKEIFEKITPSLEKVSEKLEESLESLESIIREKAENMASAQVRSGLEEALVDKLVKENGDFEIPEKWLEDEKQYLLNQLNVPKENGNMFDIDEMAERNVRRAFIIDAICDKENIQVSQEDFDSFLNEEAKKYGVKVDQIKNELQSKNLLESVAVGIRHKKALTYILNNAIIENPAKLEPKENIKEEKENE